MIAIRITRLCFALVLLVACCGLAARENAPTATIDGLRLELRDSVNGDLLAKALDVQLNRSAVTPFMMGRTRNENAARRILTDWARVLVNGLGEARASTSGRT